MDHACAQGYTWEWKLRGTVPEGCGIVRKGTHLERIAIQGPMVLPCTCDTFSDKKSLSLSLLTWSP